MLRFALDSLYFFRFHFVVFLVKSYVGLEICALISHLHVFLFPVEGGSKKLGGGGLKFLELGGLFLLGGQYPITCHEKSKK